MVSSRRHAGGRSFRRALAGFSSLLLGLGAVSAALAPSAQAAPAGNGFTVTPSDLAYILKQIKIAEHHAATRTPEDPCGTLVGAGPFQIPDRLTSYGLRTVDGSCNNLFPGREKFAAADVPFPRLTTPVLKSAEDNDGTFGPPAGPTSYENLAPGNVVVDSKPRLVSNLIVDQTSTNPAAVAATIPVRSQDNTPSAVPCSEPPAASDPADCVPAHHTLFIPNVTTDVGLSPPFNSVFTFFGQFFDHGVDQTVKTGGTVFVPLRADDPLRTLGPDGIPGTNCGTPTAKNCDEVPPSRAFMVLTRVQVAPGPDGVPNTADDVPDATNTDTPWVDQSQTYTSHGSHQAFLREYVMTPGPNGVIGDNDDRPDATGKFLGGALTAPDANGLRHNVPVAAGVANDQGISTWEATKVQARDKFGLQLVDADVLNQPMIATDPYGNVIPGPDRGLPQWVTPTGMVEGDLANPVPAPANVTRFDTPFLTDIAHNADPSPQDTDHNPATPPVAPTPDTDSVVNPDQKGPLATPGTYDDEGLDAHFTCGDGRCNENIALSAVHQIFHSEHDRLVDDITATLNDPANAALEADFRDVAPVVGNPAPFSFGERLFQAARFVTEMEYQHLVFEEFARKVVPAIRPFHVYHADTNAAVKAEFAHAVYRFGHSMLDDDVARVNEAADGTKTDNSLPLLTAFLNPTEYFDSGDPANPYNAAQAAGSILMGSSDQTGNEIDEFVTETLRNNLLGLPLDLPTLNMARARDAGIPPLNGVRRQLFAKTNDGQLAPYKNWVDFGQHLKHPESLINFVAAYGTHPTIRDSGPDGIPGNGDDVTTAAAKRAAARAIVDPKVGVDTPPEDAAAFMFGTDGTSPTCPALRCDWRNQAGQTSTGLDDVDLWVGGLAEVTNLFGGHLGSTFNYVFQTQLELLQESDRFYYLFRTPGMNLRTQLEGNSFAEIIQRNTAGTHSLKADAFATADCKFELGHITAFTPGSDTASQHLTPPLQPLTGAGAVNDDPTSTDCDENQLLQRQPDGTVEYRARNTIDPPGINGQSVYHGTPDVDRVNGGNDNDTFWGDEGNDIIEGNGGDDIALGGDGNDRITDLDGADVLKGGPGNDAEDAGPGDDIVIGGDDADFLNGGQNDNETFAGPGDDFVIAGAGADAVFGDGGDDWIEGGSGQDLLQGDHGAPFFDDPGQAEPGNDIFVGQVGENDYDAEGGDDLMSQNAAIDRNAGAAGFDWAFHQFDTVGADDDMKINQQLAGLPLPVVVNRDRWQETEADSGSRFADVIRGDDMERVTGGFGFSGCDALDETGVGRIAGLGKLVTTFPSPLQPVLDASPSGYCPLVGFNNDGTKGSGSVWAEGNILLGGAGSDVIEGRGNNDIIDGDHALSVRISIRTAPNDPASEIGSADTMESVPTGSGWTGALAGKTLQEAVFAGLVEPSQLVAVREIDIPSDQASPDNGLAGDCADATPTNCDVAVYSKTPDQYTITANADGSVTVADNAFVAAGGLFAKGDGVDTLWNLETLRFCTANDPVTKNCTAFTDLPVPGVDGGGAGNRVATATFAFTGTFAQGAALTVTPTIVDPDGVPAVSDVTLSWQALEGGDWVTVGTGDTFTPDNGEVGCALKVVAMFTDLKGTFESVESDPTDAVANVNDPATGSPVISGTARKAVALSASTGSIDDPDGIADVATNGGFHFQWQQRVGASYTDIAGATGAGFTPGQAQVGARLRVQVSFTDDQGGHESQSSDASDVVGGVLVGDAAANTLVGTDGSDVATGRGGNDTLTLNGGDDEARFSGTSGGFDKVAGGTGSDTVVATAANTVIGLRSLSGVETISAGGHAGVWIQGSGGANSLDFGSVTLTGIVRSDAGAGDDTVAGSSGSDVVLGGTGDDVLSGAGGGDNLRGNDGADTLSGGAGTDRLTGGAGADWMTGGAGVDVVVLAPGSGSDKVTDFDAAATGGQDLLDVSQLGVTSSTFAAKVKISAVAGGTRVTIGTSTVRLVGVTRSQVTKADFVLG